MDLGTVHAQMEDRVFGRARPSQSKSSGVYKGEPMDDGEEFMGANPVGLTAPPSWRARIGGAFHQEFFQEDLGGSRKHVNLRQTYIYEHFKDAG